jgi:nucleolar protein 56
MTPAGEFQIDSQGSLVDFAPVDSDDAAVEALVSSSTDILSLEGFKLFLSRQNELIESVGLSWEDYSEMRRRVALGLCKVYLAQTPGDDDLIIEAIGTLEDLQKALNLLALRLAQNYTESGVAPHYEADEIIPEAVVDVSVSHSTRISEGFAGQIKALIEYRAWLEDEIGGLMEQTAPNISGLVGPLLGARLIAVSGGLGKLAASPGSRIQVLGAQRAMFRHLKERGDPPKHGVIFQHPTISKSPWWQRGKIARSLAAKIAIAARIDKFSKVDRSAELRADFMRRYEDVKKAHPNEPRRMRIVRAPKALKKKSRRRGRKR